MPTYAWILIIISLFLLWWAWNKYGNLYTMATTHPDLVNAIQSIGHYASDIEGLKNAYQEATSEEGASFSSRFGTFFGALPK